METQENQISAKSKRKSKKLLFVLILMAALAGGGYWFFIKDGFSSKPSLNLFPYQAGDKWGYIDKKGKIIINPQFNYATLFYDGAALVVSSDSKIGYIGEDGKYLINATYKNALPFSEGLACVVTENGKPQYIDKKGNVKFTLGEGDRCGSFYEGLAAVRVKDKWGFMDKQGNMKINPQFDYYKSFCNGLAPVAIMNKDKGNYMWGYINKKGELAINHQFNRAEGFSEDLALVYDGKKYGYIDKDGKYVINPQFDEAGDFKNGLAKISQGSMTGFIDKTGKIVINPQFAGALNFSVDNATALVFSSDKKCGYIDKEGKYKINPQFEDGSNFYGDVAFIRTGDKWGIIDNEGKFIVNPQYDRINCDVDNFRNLSVESDYFDINGVVNNFLNNTDANSFRGFNISSTYSQVEKKLNTDVNKQDIKDSVNPIQTNQYSNSISCYVNEELTKEASVRRVEVYFESLISGQKPVYAQVRKHDYWKGDYYVQEIDHYEDVFNKDAHIKEASFEFEFSGKANDKKELIWEALGEAIANKLQVKNKPDFKSDRIEMQNDVIGVEIYKSSNKIRFGFLKYNEQKMEAKEEKKEEKIEPIGRP
ncbi:MAG: WG repeat-containing protein [Bacteroidetes bacterium]|nr:WG repeat-containing protein [Bacteroidota bacterium]